MTLTMELHELKTILPYFQHIKDGKKTFEVRYNDRGFKIGDQLKLYEYDPILRIYTGRYNLVNINYILESFSGLERGYIVMAIELVESEIDWYKNQHFLEFMKKAGFEGSELPIGELLVEMHKTLNLVKLTLEDTKIATYSYIKTSELNRAGKLPHA